MQREIKTNNLIFKLIMELRNEDFFDSAILTETHVYENEKYKCDIQLPHLDMTFEVMGSIHDKGGNSNIKPEHKAYLKKIEEEKKKTCTTKYLRFLYLKSNYARFPDRIKEALKRLIKSQSPYDDEVI